ncbi:MAG: polyphosphate kinase 2 family protein [Gemmataceae bacterium]|nr:polyphosphate kinase 2 family protein [Gemmataceae bacterium]
MLDSDVIDLFRVPAGKKFKLKDHDPEWAGTDEMMELGQGELKERAQAILLENRQHLHASQDLLYADNRYSVLIILQGMDASGKDGTIEHVMAGLNPQGCDVHSFKKPTPEELDHSFLWRCSRRLPERGRIGIFNRSYYEDVLIVKVHPELIASHPTYEKVGKKFWAHRYEDINEFERHLVRNGTVVLKFFLNISKKEQKRRFLERIDRPEKNWKFNVDDVKERGFWKDYMQAYQDALNATSTKWAPWYVIPADHKWVARALIADIVTSAVCALDLSFPVVSDAQRTALIDARRTLTGEDEWRLD